MLLFILSINKSSPNLRIYGGISDICSPIPIDTQYIDKQYNEIIRVKDRRRRYNSQNIGSWRIPEASDRDGICQRAKHKGVAKCSVA